MSGKALEYVKKLQTAPNGEPIRAREKGILLYLADSYNPDKGASWNSVRRIAESFNLKRRTVQLILAECISKGIIWSEARHGDRGKQTSNFWHFTELDGKPSRQQQAAYERIQTQGRIRGRRASQKRKRVGQPPSKCPQEAAPGLRPPGEDSYAIGGEEFRAMPAKISTPKPPLEPPEQEPPLEPEQEATIDPPAPATAANEKTSGTPDVIEAQLRLNKRRRQIQQQLTSQQRDMKHVLLS